MSAKKFNTPFAILGDKVEVPTTAQIDGSVSFEQGYPFGYELDYTDPNTKDISRSKTNQLLFDITNAIREIQQGGASEWSEEGKPYKINSLVYAPDGTIKQSLIANNNNDTTHSSWSTLVNASALATLDAQNVKLTGNQTVGGIKTFSSNPISTATQSTAVNALTRKDYVDGLDAQNVKKSANLSDLANKSTARTNLGLGTSATKNVGTAGGDVMQVGAFGIGTGQIKTPNTAVSGQIGYWNPIIESVDVPFGYGTYITGAGPVGSAAFQLAVQAKDALNLDNFQAVIRTCTIGETGLQDLGMWRVLIHTGNILGATGQSTTYPMTQKAVTDGLNTKVGLSGNQTIAGVKTFSSSPIVPTPTANTQVANKQYVDNNSIGVGQMWQDVSESRAVNTTYTNTTGRTIVVVVDTSSEAGALLVDNISMGDRSFYGLMGVVPNGSTYRLAGGQLQTWAELR